MQKNNNVIENPEVSDYVPVVVTSNLREQEIEEINNEAETFTQKLEGLFVDSDVWLSAENSREEDCSCVENIHLPSTPEFANIEFPQGSDQHENQSTYQMESSSDNNVPSASDLLQSVVESYRDALSDQRSIMASQTEAINRLAAAIEAQTKMISLMRDNNF